MMLELDDDDFFTPTPGTSLANIFVNKLSDKTHDSENTTLKYVAPKANECNSNLSKDPKPQVDDQVDTTTKLSECLFASAVFAYELVNNAYTPRGKLGFALLKIFTPLHIKQVLYDSNKRTLSSVNVSTDLKVKIQHNKYINYCDDMKRNWSLSCSNVEEFNIIVQKLKDLQINIIYCEEHVDRGPSPSKPTTQSTLPSFSKKASDKGSDTDSSLNRKSKISLINRIASVGQSVLPLSASVEKESESSDTDPDPHYRVSRYKTHKNNNKKLQHPEKNLEEVINIPKTDYSIGANHNHNSSILNAPIHGAEDMQLCTDLKQLVPISNFSNDNNRREMEQFISEYRVNNSELRININRVTDKVDSILEKIQNSEITNHLSTNSDFTKDIFQRLLSEYETRIKDQNEKIKKLESLLCDKHPEILKYFVLNDKLYDQVSNKHDNVFQLESKVTNLEKDNSVKTEEIDQLKKQIDGLKQALASKNQTIQELQMEYESEINNLDEKKKELEELSLHYYKLNDEHKQLQVECKELIPKPGGEQMNIQLKTIMNDTFRKLVANFENDDTYRGDTVKTIIGTIIKKITMDLLNK